MIFTRFYSGQGFGNQLWVYASLRCIAERRGLEFAFGNISKFKGKDFLKLEFGSSFEDDANSPDESCSASGLAYYREVVTRHPLSGADVSTWDPELELVADGTAVDGTMQAEKYLRGFKRSIQDWFAVPGEHFDGCVISLRGGEYKKIKDVFLPKSYFDDAIAYMRCLDPDMRFLVVTDDAGLAKEYFPGFPVVTSGGVKRFMQMRKDPKSSLIGRDFASIQNAKHLILSNSSFSWWGAYSSRFVQTVIAPKYWARFNVSDGYWSNGDSLTSDWLWLDRFGNFQTYDECRAELGNNRK